MQEGEVARHACLPVWRLVRADRPRWHRQIAAFELPLIPFGWVSAGTHISFSRRTTIVMAKSQKRSAREIRKPKAAAAKPVVGISAKPEHPVNALMQKPKGKL